ncbi:MAG: glycosyltransferase [Acidimicrobiia bacterium]|nr:glycosyltransferase [Acidimicrobiia bacterium]
MTVRSDGWTPIVGYAIGRTIDMSSEIGKFISLSALWPPRLVSELSAWNEHIPFAGWVIEATRPRIFVELGTHAGVSYFSFCESVARLGLATECFAVDTWQGDEHAGFYDEDIYQSVQRTNSEYFESFSTLLRKTFDEAVDGFADASIDLLHIDGLHTYEAVKHDFDTWLPKLSDRAVVLLHDTQERKGDFGVYVLMEELATEYPTFEFTHGHGLGVIGVGVALPAALSELVGLSDQAEIIELRTLYSHLGKRISAEHSALQANKELAGSRKLAKDLEKQLEHQKDISQKLAEARDTRKSQLDVATRDLEHVRRTMDEATAALKEQVRTLEQALTNAERDLAATTRKLQAVTVERKALVAHELEPMQEKVRAQSQRIRQLQVQIEQATHQLHQTRQDLEQLARRRIVKAALAAATPARPLFRLLRSNRSDTGPPLDDSVDDGTGIARMTTAFDARRSQIVTDELTTIYEKHRAQCEAIKVSIVMPTYNRAHQIETAIESVLEQTHTNWELLIVDDGSDDDTALVLAPYLSDDRIQLFTADHEGVSAARNRALDEASGDLIAYLDTDNTWTPGYLMLMVAHFQSSDTDLAYAGLAVVEDSGDLKYFRGEEFDWDECRAANYVDLNVFMHKRDFADEPLRFDTSLRRMVDWDFILRGSRDRAVGYVPFVGCQYSDGDSEERISRSEPIAYREIVQIRNPSDGPLPEPHEIADQLSLRFAIRIAAPRGKRNEWGDFHYATALERTLTELGHQVRIIYVDDENQGVGDDHVNLVIRGLTRYPAISGQINVLWSISHPDIVSLQELSEFDLVYVASDSYAALLAHVEGVTPRILHQATAIDAPPEPTTLIGADEVLFVGNSRKAHRPVVEWAVEAGARLAVFGNGWEETIVEPFVRSINVSNERLGSLYARADWVLNDHWPSMQAFGYVSNRVFDVLGAGGRLISDTVPSLEVMFPGSIAQVGSAADVRNVLTDPPDLAGHGQSATEVRSHHTFAYRSRQMIGDILDHLQVEIDPDHPRSHVPWVTSPEPAATTHRTVTAAVTPFSDKTMKVGLVVLPGGSGYQSSAYIRLICPLTSETVKSKIDLMPVTDFGELPLAELDAVVVQRHALGSVDEASSAVERLRSSNVPLVLDNDDALALLDPTHPEYAKLSQKSSVIDLLLESADHAWFSTPNLEKAYGREGSEKSSIMPNSLDPRLWRRYRQQRPTRTEGPLQLVYMGTATHDADFGMVTDALDAWNPVDGFTLTIIGAVREPPPRSWLRVLDIPRAESSYPRFVRWLLEQGPFDIGIAPLVDNEFNRSKSDIKFLDMLGLGTLPVVSDLSPYSGDARVLKLAEHAPGTAAGWLEALRTAADRVRDDERRAMGFEYLWNQRNAGDTGTSMIDDLHQILRN